MNMLKFRGLSSVFSITMLLIVDILMVMSLIGTADAVTTYDVEITENGSKVDVLKTTVTDTQGVVDKKYKQVKTYTLTFNANGGKVTIKTKKLAYKKSYGTLPKPTRSGYTFDGWYTKKAGGKKVSQTTKMSAKNMVFYAHWKKNQALNAYEKELVWNYLYSAYGFADMFSFNADGTYVRATVGGSHLSIPGESILRANWAITTKGEVRLTNCLENYTYTGGGTRLPYKNKPYPDEYRNYVIEKESGIIGIRIDGGSFFYEKQKGTVNDIINNMKIK